MLYHECTSFQLVVSRGERDISNYISWPNLSQESSEIASPLSFWAKHCKQESVLYILAEVSVELGRAVQMNFNLENVEELTEFIDGLVLPGDEDSGGKGSQTGASGRTLLLRSFNLCTSDMLIQLEAPPVLGKPKLLCSVLGIEAKASLKSDLQGM